MEGSVGLGWVGSGWPQRGEQVHAPGPWLELRLSTEGIAARPMADGATSESCKQKVPAGTEPGSPQATEHDRGHRETQQRKKSATQC